MNRECVWGAIVPLLALLCALCTDNAFAQETETDELSQAILKLRNISPGQMTEEQEKAKARELSQAWKTISSAGADGAAKLKEEIRSIDEKKETDPFFKLGAAALLWEIGKLEEAKSIAEIWKNTPLTVNYNYVFYTAFAAAKTQDERALPMLKACLGDDKGTIFIAQHAMRLQWPLTHQFLWGAYGPKAIHTLLDVLKSSKNSVELKAAAQLLARTQCIEALPLIRKLISHSDAELRHTAVRCLGVYGHPDDYETLVAGLKSEAPEDVWYYVFALYEYEDLRAVPHIVPLLKSEHGRLRKEAYAALTHLKTSASFEAIQKCADEAPTEREKKNARRFVDRSLKNAGLTWQDYERKSAQERQDWIAVARAREEQRYQLKKGDRKLTHDELVEAAKEWKQQHRITGGKFAWVEDRHVLSAATSADLNLLREVEASLYWRLSDESLYEIETVNGLIRRVGRSRYRKVVGITEKVEPAAEAAR